jgi:hypothetical protein
MKRILLLIAALSLSAVASAPLMAQAMMQANPFVGTWKLNTAKSKFTGVPMPKSLTREVVAQGGGAKFSYKGVGADGTPIEYYFVTNYDGKDCPIVGSGAPGGADAIVVKRVGSSKAEAVLKKGGTEISKSWSDVSKDGKVSTVKGSGKTPDGKDFNTVAVYDKQ